MVSRLHEVDRLSLAHGLARDEDGQICRGCSVLQGDKLKGNFAAFD